MCRTIFTAESEFLKVMPTVQSIAFICPRFSPSGTVGGAETLLKNLAERVAAAGCRVDFLTTCAADHFTWANELPPGVKHHAPGMDVHYFPVAENRNLAEFLRAQDLIDRGARYTEADEMAWISNSVTSPALCRHLAEKGVDYDRIIVGPYLFGLTWYAAREYPDRTLLIPCLHDEKFARVRAFKRMFHSVGGVIFNSRPEQEFACRLYGLPIEHTRVVGMGLELFSVDPAAFTRRRGLTSPYVMYSGRREAGKGVPLLLDYLALFRERTGHDVKLVLTGKGAIDSPAGLTAHVIDLGFVSEQEKREAMAGAAVFCQPSVNESFSIVLLEAWLAGTPALVHARCAVTTDHCRRSGGGLWFMTYPEFEMELGLLLSKPELRSSMGASGRDYVKREYSWEKILQKFRAALAELCAGNKQC